MASMTSGPPKYSFHQICAKAIEHLGYQPCHLWSSRRFSSATGTCRLRTVEGVATALQATVESQANTIQTLIRRASDSTGWASAPEFNTNGKRALADIDGDDAAKRQQLAPPPLQQLAPPPVAVINIVEPPAFSYPTAPAPAFAYPMAPPAPAYAAPGFAPVALPTAPPDAPYVLPNAPPPPTRTLPVAPSAPGAPPRVPPNPAREAGLGPMDWQ
ncbi:hypothetical protein C8J57DRAFT_1236763 [Mycena rebaudengoi]|nr:hypothetical protein C8J57DRAFT_1236763 [Mycena rebaudengoi]